MRIGADFFDNLEHQYNIYTIIGLLLSLLYIAASIFVLLVPPENLNVTLRDYVSGIFFAMIFFGIPVLMFIGAFGLIYVVTTKLKGKWIAFLTFISPWIFLSITLLNWPDVFR